MNLDFGATIEHLPSGVDEQSNQRDLVIFSEYFNELMQKVVELEQENEELRQQLCEDPLTGVYNRRKYNEVFENLVEEAQEKGIPLAILAADIDGLKSVNDDSKDGHVLGDKLIRSSAEGLAKVARATDLVIRMGGDEFVVIMPGFKPNDGQSDEELFLETLSRFMESTADEITKLGLPGNLKPGLSMAMVILQPGEDAAAVFERVDFKCRQNKKTRKELLELTGFKIDDDRLTA